MNKGYHTTKLSTHNYLILKYTWSVSTLYKTNNSVTFYNLFLSIKLVFKILQYKIEKGQHPVFNKKLHTSPIRTRTTNSTVHTGLNTFKILKCVKLYIYIYIYIAISVAVGLGFQLPVRVDVQSNSSNIYNL